MGLALLRSILAEYAGYCRWRFSRAWPYQACLAECAGHRSCGSGESLRLGLTEKLNALAIADVEAERVLGLAFLRSVYSH
jgi:hypothetical protein